MLGERRGKGGRGSGGALTDSTVYRRAHVSETGVCDLSVEFFEGVRDLHSCCNRIVNGHHLLGARNRVPGHEDVVKGATRGSGGTF